MAGSDEVNANESKVLPRLESLCDSSVSRCSLFLNSPSCGWALGGVWDDNWELVWRSGLWGFFVEASLFWVVSPELGLSSFVSKGDA